MNRRAMSPTRMASTARSSGTLGAFALATLLGALLTGCAGSSRAETNMFEAMTRTESSTYAGASGATTADGQATDDEPLPPGADLADYLALALGRNPGVEAAFNRWKAALYRVPQVRALPEPRVTYGYYLREVETRTGPQQQRVGLSQAFPWFGTLQGRADVAMAEATAMERAFEATKLDLFLRVKKAYFEYGYLARAIAITHETIALVKELEDVARTRYQANLASHPDVIRAQLELGKLEDRIRTLEDYERPIRAQLNAALDRAPDAPLPAAARLSETTAVFTESNATQWLLENNPELRAIDARINRERAAIELKKKGYFPSFALNAEYIDTDSAIMHNTPDSSRDPILVGVSLTLPLWFEKTDAAVAEARSRLFAQQKERTERKNRLRSDLELAFYQYRDAGRKIGLYRDTLIPKAEQSLGATQEAYIAERVGFLDLIDAERVLLEFRLAFDRALADRAIGLATIEKVIGREISPASELTERKESP